jgi:hypothetical protein
VSPINANSALGFEAWIDDTLMFDISSVQTSTEVSIPMPDDVADHVLKMVLKGKCAEHTIVDSDGNILSDSVLTISDLAFDGIVLGKIVYDKATYTHNFNGSSKSVEEQFFDTMGCNGTVALKFSTPVYLWLLENM